MTNSCQEPGAQAPSRIRRRSVGPALAAAAVLLGARAAQAHAGGATIRENVWSAWNPDPVIQLNLALLACLYARGVVRIWRRGGLGRGISVLQAAAFGGAMAALVIALVSPIDALSDELSWVHMLQHMILMMIAAPLFVLGAPAVVLAGGASRGLRQAAGRWRRRLRWWQPAGYVLWQPLALWALYALTLWVWHFPPLYHAALRNPIVHDLQHLTFFVAACAFWRVLFDPVSRLRLSRGLGVLYLFTTSLHASALGVFMTLSPVVWYSEYEGRTAVWNLTALEDQQLAGLIMWMPACMVYAVAAAVLFAVWLQEWPE